MPRVRLVHLVALALCLIVACIVPVVPGTSDTRNTFDHLITETPPPKIEVQPGAICPDSFPAGINPLTGQPAPDPAALDRRPLVVKISNAPPIVRLLSPFDPLIIQRKRLLQFFGYQHRFEAYVRQEKRVFGYFALPVLIGDAIVAAYKK